MADNKLAIKQETVDAIELRIRDLQKNGEISFPQYYSPSNALKSAYLMLQETVDMAGKPALEVCTRESIQNALFNMTLLALSPAKKQVYAIVRGKTLCLDTSYFGVIAATKRLKGVKDIFAQVVFEGDVFEYEIRQGRKIIVKHEQKMQNIDTTKILGAYCTIVYEATEGDELVAKEYTEVMSQAQISTSWSKTKMKSGTVQKEFPEEMAKRTVIKRACKLFVNTSDDSDLMIEAYNATADVEPTDKDDAVTQEIKDRANKEVIDVVYTVSDAATEPEIDVVDPTPPPAEVPPTTTRERKW